MVDLLLLYTGLGLQYSSYWYSKPLEIDAGMQRQGNLIIYKLGGTFLGLGKQNPNACRRGDVVIETCC